jgi:hypothetical protein
MMIYTDTRTDVLHKNFSLISLCKPIQVPGKKPNIFPPTLNCSQQSFLELVSESFQNLNPDPFKMDRIHQH